MFKFPFSMKRTKIKMFFFIWKLKLCWFAAALQSICTEYHKKIMQLEGDKFDIEWKMTIRAFEVNETLKHTHCWNK